MKHGDEDAAQQLWSRYAMRLLDIARKRLGARKTAVADEEDVAQLVFASLCRGASAGRFHDVRNRDELWWMLLTITKRKATDQLRRQTAKKRGSGHVVSETQINMPRLNGGANWTFDNLVGQDPTPEHAAIFSEEYTRLMFQLPNERMRRIASLRIEGYTVPEISAELSVAQRTVERKLQLIRDKWAHAVATS